MRTKVFIVMVMLSLSVLFVSCGDFTKPTAVSDSGVTKATVNVTTNVNGKTIEQENYIERIRRDNLPGSIKHLYVISSTSGQVLIYSTVKGKVTSSGKRITPSTVLGDGQSASTYYFNYVQIADNIYLTNEVLGDDGTYGSSIEYLYWFDSKGVYHQHYKGANEMLHISDQPLAVKSIVLNLEER